MNSTNANSQKVILDEIINYEHQGVVTRMMKDLGISEMDAKELFNDAKKFLFLTAIAEKEISPTKPIDDAWHTFLLFTKDYYDFCCKFFGYIIHHNPFDEQEQKEKGIIGLRLTMQLAQSYLNSPLSKNWELQTNESIGCGGCGGCGGGCESGTPPICCSR